VSRGAESNQESKGSEELKPDWGSGITKRRANATAVGICGVYRLSTGNAWGRGDVRARLKKKVIQPKVLSIRLSDTRRDQASGSVEPEEWEGGLSAQPRGRPS